MGKKIETKESWQNAQEFELNWHNHSSMCANDLGEKIKQVVYIKRMGLSFTRDPNTPYNLEFNGESVVDVGSGPYSVLLAARGFSNALVIDPLMDKFPEWVRMRYESAGIKTLSIPAEEWESPEVFDTALIYNCLQHVQNPEKIIKNVLSSCRILRIFEWVDTGTNVGHLHNLTEVELNKWLGGIGKVENLNESGCCGRGYFGIFKGAYYGT